MGLEAASSFLTYLELTTGQGQIPTQTKLASYRDDVQPHRLLWGLLTLLRGSRRGFHKKRLPRPRRGPPAKGWLEPAAGDYDGNGKIEGVQTEVKGLMAKLAALLPRDANGVVLNSPVDNSNSTEAQRKAIWNYKLIEIDGSAGVHNTSFTVQLLQKTYKELTGQNVPGATLR